MFSYGFDKSSGKALNGAYKNYVIEKLGLWARFRNMLTTRIFLKHIREIQISINVGGLESLPNQ